LSEQARRLPSILNAFTLFDLAICAVFAVPFTAMFFLAGLDWLSYTLGLGSIELPGVLGQFFINFAGVLGVAWNVHMLRNPDRSLHQIDVYARCAVIGLIAFYILRYGLSPLFAVFIVTELAGGIAKQAWLRNAPPA